MWPRLKWAVTASAATAVRRTTSAEASLTRLSPSSTVIRRGGSPTRCPIAVAATASVGLTTAPSAVARANEMLGNSACTSAPTTNADTITITIDSHAISPTFRRTSSTGSWTADA